MNAEPIPCAICGATQTRALYRKFGHTIGRCIRCGLVYANPRAPREAILERYSPDYFWNEYLPALGVVNGRYDLAAFDARYAPLLNLIEAAPGRRLLEVGCGAGFFLKAAERAGWRVAGIDLSDEGSRFAREKLGLDVRQERAEAMTAERGSFDAVAMFDAIEHLFDPRAVLESAARALRPGGLLVVSTPNFNALSRHVLGSAWAVLGPLEHTYYFERRTLARLVEACGFIGVTFALNPAWTPQQTMNFAYTHAPHGLRASVFRAIVLLGGSALGRAVQLAGRQDTLLCVARTRG